jgi:hypothetical protein
VGKHQQTIRLLCGFFFPLIRQTICSVLNTTLMHISCLHLIAIVIGLYLPTLQTAARLTRVVRNVATKPGAHITRTIFGPHELLPAGCAALEVTRLPFASVSVQRSPLPRVSRVLLCPQHERPPHPASTLQQRLLVPFVPPSAVASPRRLPEPAPASRPPRHARTPLAPYPVPRAPRPLSLASSATGCAHRAWSCPSRVSPQSPHPLASPTVCSPSETSCSPWSSMHRLLRRVASPISPRAGHLHRTSTAQRSAYPHAPRVPLLFTARVSSMSLPTTVPHTVSVRNKRQALWWSSTKSRCGSYMTSRGAPIFVLYGA